jgi:hypothetical protein
MTKLPNLASKEAVGFAATVDDRRKRQTFAATPAEPGDLPWGLAPIISGALRSTDCGREGEAIATLVANKMRGGVRIAAVKAPGRAWPPTSRCERAVRFPEWGWRRPASHRNARAGRPVARSRLPRPPRSRAAAARNCRSPVPVDRSRPRKWPRPCDRSSTKEFPSVHLLGSLCVGTPRADVTGFDRVGLARGFFH